MPTMLQFLSYSLIVYHHPLIAMDVVVVDVVVVVVAAVGPLLSQFAVVT